MRARKAGPSSRAGAMIQGGLTNQPQRGGSVRAVAEKRKNRIATEDTESTEKKDEIKNPRFSFLFFPIGVFSVFSAASEANSFSRSLHLDSSCTLTTPFTLQDPRGLPTIRRPCHGSGGGNPCHVQGT